MKFLRPLLKTLPATPALLRGLYRRARAPPLDIPKLTTQDEIDAFKVQHPRRLLVDVSRSNLSETGNRAATLLRHWMWEEIYRNISQSGLDLAMAEIERADPSLTEVYEPAERTEYMNSLLKDHPTLGGRLGGRRWFVARPDYNFESSRGVYTGISSDIDFAIEGIRGALRHCVMADNVTAGEVVYSNRGETDGVWGSSRNAVAPVGALLVQLAPQDVDEVVPVLRDLASKREGVALLVEISENAPRKSSRVYKYASYPHLKTDFLLPKYGDRGKFLRQHYASIVGEGHALLKQARASVAASRVWTATRDQFYHVMEMDRDHGTLPSRGLHVEFSQQDDGTNVDNLRATMKNLASQSQKMLLASDIGTTNQKKHSLSQSNQRFVARDLYNATELRDLYRSFLEDVTVP